MMQPDDITRGLTAAVAFASLMAGHYAGDQWIQTGAQACKKALNAPGARLGDALWHCAKHVITYSLGGLLLFLGAAAWLDLPVRPGWVAAGIAVNAVTHFVVDLRTPLIWLAVKAGHGSYLKDIQVVRPFGVSPGGPGTAMFHLDQAWHFFWILPAAMLFAGP